MKEAARRAFNSCTFIINPSRFPEYSKLLKKILRRTNVPRLIESTSKEHFVDCVREFCESDDRYLLVWGGDGTAHDAINTFVRMTRQTPEIAKTKSIGFLRGGSGNGIQDSYEVPFRIKKQVLTYAESMTNNYTVDVDLLEIQEGDTTSYCQLVGFGFDAQVLKNRTTYTYRRGPYKGSIRRGTPTYIRSALRTFVLDYSTISRGIRLDLYDGKYAFKGTRVNAELPFSHHTRDTDAVEVEIGSRPYYGKLFKICPDVVCNDGYLDVYLYNLQSRRVILQNAVWLWTGRHDRINKKFAKDEKALIERYEVKRVDISSEAPLEYHVDGEVRTAGERTEGQYAVGIRVLPRQVTFIVPGEFYRKFHPFDVSD